MDYPKKNGLRYVIFLSNLRLSELKYDQNLCLRTKDFETFVKWGSWRKETASNGSLVELKRRRENWVVGQQAPVLHFHLSTFLGPTYTQVWQPIPKFDNLPYFHWR